MPTNVSPTPYPTYGDGNGAAPDANPASTIPTPAP